MDAINKPTLDELDFLGQSGLAIDFKYNWSETQKALYLGEHRNHKGKRSLSGRQCWG